MTIKNSLVTEARRAQIIAELERRKAMPNILSYCFPEQLKFIKDKSKRKALFVSRRCLGENTSIITSMGPKAIKDIQIGDIVYSEEGKQIKVINKYDNGEREVYNLKYGNKILATSTLDHIWQVKTAHGSIKELTLEDINSAKILKTYVKAPLGTINEPHAYVLGALLGDGCSKQGVNQIHISSEDKSIPEKCAEILNCYYEKAQGGNYTWVLKSTNIKYALGELPHCNYYKDFCQDKYAHEKYIDLDLIKTWNRKSLLQFVAGLIDTEGSVYISSNTISFRISMQSKSCIDAIEYACLALWQCIVSRGIDNRDKYKNGPCYCLQIKSNLFVPMILKELDEHLVVERKKYKLEYEQLNIHNEQKEQVGIYKEYAGIQRTYDLEVDSKTHLYLTATGLHTHNSGKSTAIAIHLLLAALTNPRVKILYLGLSKKSAENAIWKDAIEQICRKFKIVHKYNMNTQTIEFENKSTIKLTGADSSRTDMDKLLGGKYFIVAIDECQSWTQDLDRLVNIVFAPAVTDYIKKGGGQIILAGTPGPHMGDAWYWYNLTKPIQDDKKIKGWNVHHWDPLDNPHMKEEILDTWALLEKAHGPRYRERPDFRSEWLCQWVLQEGLKVYNYDKAINKIVEKEDFTATSLDSNTLSLLFAAEQDTKRTLLERDKKWFYILGCDLGFIDDCAWVVGAFNKTDNMFYFVESFSHNKINLKVFADITKGLMLKYSFRSMVVDEGGLGKMMADTCRTHYQIPFKPAEKTGKESFIYTMNSDFSTGQIKVIHQSNVKLIKEWDELIIDEKAAKEGIFKEAEKYKNHLSDAALYCYREGKHYLSKPEPVKINDIAQRIIDQQKKSRFPNRDNSYRDSWQEHIENQRIIDTFRGSK